MSKSPTVAEGQHEPFSISEATDQLNRWLEKQWPDVTTNTDLSKVLTRENVLPKFKGKEAALAIYVGHLRKGRWEGRNHCPREVARTIFDWMGMDKSKIPLCYLAQLRLGSKNEPPVKPKGTTPGISTSDTDANCPDSADEAESSRITDITASLSADDTLIQHFLRVAAAYIRATRNCKELFVKTAAIQGKSGDKTATALERHLDNVMMLARALDLKFNPNKRNLD